MTMRIGAFFFRFAVESQAHGPVLNSERGWDRTWPQAVTEFWESDAFHYFTGGVVATAVGIF